jgi:molybdenum cofactor synthesis domain-containing protein
LKEEMEDAAASCSTAARKSRLRNTELPGMVVASLAIASLAGANRARGLYFESSRSQRNTVLATVQVINLSWRGIAMKAAILTLSDKGFRGERADLSGPALASWLSGREVEIARTEVIPDEADLISAKLAEWADGGEFDLILTTGGTGVSPRDVTPDATVRVLDRVIPGFGEAMRAASLTKTPQAMISRAVSGVRKRTLIVNLPGSPRGAIENLEAVWPAIPHALEKIQGDMGDCVKLTS